MITMQNRNHFIIIIMKCPYVFIVLGGDQRAP